MSDAIIGRAEPADVVVPLRRPPIRQSTVVASSAAHTFSVFTRRLAEWWPLTPFSYGGDRVRHVSVEERVGGDVSEVWDDGTTVSWGEVLEWAPPTALTMTWNITGTPTEVALRFVPLAPSLTRVDLEHRGWERLSDAELDRDCALPGGYNGGAFQTGWTEILGRLRTAVERHE